MTELGTILATKVAIEDIHSISEKIVDLATWYYQYCTGKGKEKFTANIC